MIELDARRASVQGLLEVPSPPRRSVRVEGTILLAWTASSKGLSRGNAMHA